jgi:hypothetical protein
MLYNLKTLWRLTKKHARAYAHDIQWHFSHIKFYAKRMSLQFKKYPYKQEDYTYWAKLPEDPSVYPFDKQKADSALYEVSRWIREDDNQPSDK